MAPAVLVTPRGPDQEEYLLIDQSLAHPAQTESNKNATRELRGIALYEEHAEEIRFSDGVWLVPSQHDLTSVYEVKLGLRPSCECKDFEFHGRRDGSACKHIRAARLAEASLVDEDLRIDYPVEEELLATCERALKWFETWDEHAAHENDFGGKYQVMKRLCQAVQLAYEEV
jgi:hypothetical protein